jgi:deaminated glutathione amidase
LHDLSDEEITDFFQTVCLVQKVTEKIYNSTSSTVTVQDGTDAGQTVKHVHCHVMPRKPGDFEHNDDIYTELNRHDHDGSIKRRPLDEMIKEAEVFKRYF